MTGAGDAFLGVGRSFSGKRWAARLADERGALLLAQRLEQPEIVGRILAARGIDADAAPEFLNPTLRTQLPDPSTFLDMNVAVERLLQAIEGEESIAVFGDYDVDGATASALLARYLRLVGSGCRIYVPDRLREGYGPNAAALEALRSAGVSLVVTVDCGTGAFEALESAARSGLDVIVIDHHVAEAALPPCHALVNPNRLDETGAYRQLAAVGVAFLLLVALNRALRHHGRFARMPEPNLLDLLDLVALGTVCDVVPLTGVNRALVAQGLKVMARRGNTGLAALAVAAGLDDRPGAYHAGFILGPRVNAGGRVGRSDLGARLLSTDDRNEAEAIAAELNRFNAERRAIESLVLEQAIEAVDAAAGTPAAVAVGRSWHPGVIGIVASRLKDRFGRPAFVISLEDGIGKGSARSVPGVDLGALITAARQAGLLMNGGGHPMAAGFTIAEAKIDALLAFLETRLAAADVDRVASLSLDGALAAGAATAELVALLDKAGPFGAGNPEPRLVFPNVRLVQAAPVGDAHVSCVFAGRDGGRLAGIAFRCLDGDLGPAVLSHVGRPLHVAGRLRTDRWQARERVRIHIDDAAPA